MVNLEHLQRFVGFPVEIAILDSEAVDQAPTIHETVKKIQLCPDVTHIRFFFNDTSFIAVPLASSVKETETEWSALDHESGLHYKLKKV